jgi:uncharacterized membrane protein YedE/YeeE
MAVVGALLSAMACDALPSDAAGARAGEAFLGGFLMLFGSRMGSGCTSGHGERDV